MPTWKCFGQHGMYYVEALENPSNSARQCILYWEWDAGDFREPDTKIRDFEPPEIFDEPKLDTKIRGLDPTEVLKLPYREPGLSVAAVPVFRDPVGPTIDDTYTDPTPDNTSTNPTMPDVVNPPSSPTTNLLQGPWNGKLTLSANKGIDPKFDFGAASSDDMSGDDPWKKALSYWPWLLGAAVAYYLWRRK